MLPAQTDVKEYSYFAGNQWRKSADNQVFDVHEPYSGKLFARVAAGTRTDARVAVDAAAKAFPAWAETTPAEKARLFLKASEIVKRRRSEIAEVLARETGSTISFATFQQDLVAATLQQVAGWVYLPKGEVLETNAPGSHSIGMRRPLGVVASFTPWNGANVLSWCAVISPVAAANRTMYGLTSSILAGNTYKAFEMAPKILAGIVNVNSPTVNDEIHAPMGGVRDSGWGRTGPRSLEDFSDLIWINSHSGQRQYPF
jgi:acyl-CoA reductase-like NAD-dependent aldehyde dehydrogenase